MDEGEELRMIVLMMLMLKMRPTSWRSCCGVLVEDIGVIGNALEDCPIFNTTMNLLFGFNHEVLYLSLIAGSSLGHLAHKTKGADKCCWQVRGFNSYWCYNFIFNVIHDIETLAKLGLLSLVLSLLWLHLNHKGKNRKDT